MRIRSMLARRSTFVINARSRPPTSADRDEYSALKANWPTMLAATTLVARTAWATSRPSDTTSRRERARGSTCPTRCGPNQCGTSYECHLRCRLPRPPQDDDSCTTITDCASQARSAAVSWAWPNRPHSGLALPATRPRRDVPQERAGGGSESRHGVGIQHLLARTRRRAWPGHERCSPPSGRGSEEVVTALL